MRDLHAILKLRVPIIARLAYRSMKLDEVLDITPGTILEMPKQSDQPLDLMVKNVVVGQGRAVKVGEHFGLRVTAIGDMADRVEAIR